MERKLEVSLLNTSTYNLFSQTIKRKSNTTFTEVLNGIFLLLSQYEDRLNYFHIKKDYGFEIFDNGENHIFKNIDENIKFKTLEKVFYNLDTSHPRDIVINKVPILKPSLQNLKNFNNYIKIVFQLKDLNNLILNPYSEDSSVLIDICVKRLFHDILYKTDKIIHYNENKLCKNKLKLKKPIKIDHEKVKLFDKSHCFFHVPTHRTKNGSDIKALDVLIRYMLDNTPYQKLIIISGDNDYKNYCWKKYKIHTTEKYTQIETTNLLHDNNENFISKNKSNLSSLIKDYLYIQESEAGYIHLRNLFLKYPDILKDEIFKEEKLKFWYTTFFGFDVGPMILKNKKVINYET